MICKLFVFRHAETYDNYRGVFSGWRDSGLTLKGLEQAQKIAERLKRYRVDYAFTSHLRRARETLQIVLQDHHPPIPVFIDDRLIERCYGLLQGDSKAKFEQNNPVLYAQIHRGYDFVPPEGESLRMVEKRILPFLEQLAKWVEKNPCNVAISCHGNSIRPIVRVFEHLSVEQMLQLECSHGCLLIYDFQPGNFSIESPRRIVQPRWNGIVISGKVKLATDPMNLLKKYY